MSFVPSEAQSRGSRLTRAEKNESTRSRLIEAAVKVVGRSGYHNASVSEITSEAEVAQGTFYKHFESRQALLNLLLPRLGKDLLAYVNQRVRGSTGIEREARSMRAYFDFVFARPEFHRILVEAQVYAPESYSQHIDNLMRSYVASLTKSKKNGFLTAYEPSEFPAIAAFLMGARVSLGSGLWQGRGPTGPLPESAIQTLVKLVEDGLSARPDASSPLCSGPGAKFTLVNSTTLKMELGTLGAERSRSQRYRSIRDWCSDVAQLALVHLIPGDPEIECEQFSVNVSKNGASIVGVASVDFVNEGQGALNLRLFSMDDPVEVVASGQLLFRKASPSDTDSE